MSKKKDYYQLEKKIRRYQETIEKLEQDEENIDRAEIKKLRDLIAKEWALIEPSLSPMQRVQIARHPNRPYTLDYTSALLDDFLEFHGDRRAGDDPAIVAGLGFYKGRSICLIGHQKGRTTKLRIDRNFGQPNPEGYRKALRIMRLAEKFGFPVITLIDTPGAYPGIKAEERGQAEAIAFNLKEISQLKVPVINIVIGEGGSGGALAIGVGDILMMLENSFYSVISPEGCAAILYRDQGAAAQEKVPQTAAALKFMASDLMELDVADLIIPEPAGGAHVDWAETFRQVDHHLSQALNDLTGKPVEEMLEARYQKYRKIGVFTEK